MITGLDSDEISNFGIILFFCVGNGYAVHIILGCLIGWLFAIITQASEGERKLMATCIGFGDVTGIPLTLTTVLGTSELFKDDPSFGSNSKTYVLIYNVFITAFKWSVAYV
jgi:hypothetical protein